MYVEILGFKSPTNQRHCNKHSVCGEIVAVGTMVYLKPTTIKNTQNTVEFAIEAVVIADGVEGCRVGFLAKEFHMFSNKYEHKLVQIIDLLDQARNSEHRRRSHLNYGIAVGYLLN